MIKIKPITYLLLIVFFSCNRAEKPPVAESDTMRSGTSVVFADESFKPIIDEELTVFLASNPQAKLKVRYQDEQAIFNDLLESGGKMIIAGRPLSKSEVNQLKKKNFSPEVNKLAIDATALIINKASKDTSITLSLLRDLLSGKNKNYSIVFDNPKSGIVRHLKEISGSSLTQNNIYALKSNVDVIKYVSTHTDAIGVIGFNWLNDPPADYSKYVEDIKLISVKDEKTKTYFKPSQTTLALKQYPLSRSIFVINATGRLGLGTGFANFLLGERGQRILLKSELLPEQIPPREINIKN